MKRLRLVASIVGCLLSGCCSAAAAGAAQPSAVSSPQRAVTSNSGGVAAGPAVPAPTTSPAPPPVQPLYLWCAQPTGAACRTVATTLGVEPVGVEGMPEVIFRTVEDLANDCDAEGMRELSARLGGALGLPAARWHDHGGNQLPREHVADIFYAAGCLNCCNAALPAVKMSTMLGPPRSVLVRVWEIGMQS